MEPWPEPVPPVPAELVEWTRESVEATAGQLVE
jgi:hypothetical protein